jgi:anti-sigma factor RsiW
MRLELIMTDTKLSPDDVRALLSDHLEGALDAPTRAEVDAALASDPALADERRRLERTIAALKALPKSDAPVDMVGKVRDRLAAERRRALAEAPTLTMRQRPRWLGIEGAVGLAAVASIAVFIAVLAQPSSTGGHGTGPQTAGSVTGDEAAVNATLVAPGMASAVVAELASKAGMSVVDGAPAGTFEGDRRSAARFVMSLKQAAAEKGVAVSGFVPDATRVRIVVLAK